ncbi:hypothetical protein F5884DRAFT_498661 [Xylogone sp. PMI_703]|nr:hypothetical protein F5884DRAFT_498661 [Xylogone sp. PMI_703]
MATEKRPSPKPANVSRYAAVELLPWDPDSPAHVERLYNQRVVCGWGKDSIESYRELQRKGSMALQWIILPSNEPSMTPHLGAHAKAYPAESTPLLDTASSLGGKPRTPSNTSFLPVGHISLSTDGTNPELTDASKGIYYISAFYVSNALQGLGLGRAAMDLVEKAVIDPPLSAKVLTLDTIADSNGRDNIVEWFLRQGLKPPVVWHRLLPLHSVSMLSL